MPARVIKPSVCTSKSLAALSDGGERLFTRLLTHSDDFGLFEADPQIVRCNCFPRMLDAFPEARVAALLRELVEAGVVELYHADGREYGRFLTFEKHNRLRATRPKHPLPDDGTPINPDDMCQRMTAHDSTCCHKTPEAEAEADTESDTESESESDTESESESESEEKKRARRRAVLPPDHWAVQLVGEYHEARGSKPVNSAAEAVTVAKLESVDGHTPALVRDVLLWAATHKVEPPQGSWCGWAKVVRSLASVRDRKRAGYPSKFENVLEQYRESSATPRIPQTRYPSRQADMVRCEHCGHLTYPADETCTYCAAPRRVANG